MAVLARSVISRMSSPSFMLSEKRRRSLVTASTNSLTPEPGPWLMKASCTDSQPLCRALIEPHRLEVDTSACFFAVPAALSRAFCSLFQSASEAFMIARKPPTASSPARPFARLACSSLSRPLKSFRSSCMIARRLFILPSPSFMLKPSVLIAAAACLGCVARRLKSERKAVPAFSALMPWLAIRPIARAVSSILNPNVPARGATYWNV